VRTQFVELDGFTSSSVEIECGVPQGSILGPLLYLIYVNDIYNSCSGTILSFADDTTIYLSNSNLNQLYHNANIQINKLFNWFCAIKLSLNAGKTNYIVIRPKHMRCNLTGHDMFIQNTKLNRIDNDCDERAIKCLGLYIDENLTWKYHLTNINKKISNSLFAIKQVKQVLPYSYLKPCIIH
jgi:hypothetical protein